MSSMDDVESTIRLMEIAMAERKPEVADPAEYGVGSVFQHCLLAAAVATLIFFVLKALS